MEAPTGLFTDIEGSTRLWEQVPEGMQAALARHDEAEVAHRNRDAEVRCAGAGASWDHGDAGRPVAGEEID